MKLVFTLLVFSSLTPWAAAADLSPKSVAQRRIVAGLEQVTIDPARRLRGKGFKWDHEIQIALPASYGQSNRSYPVLWVTDGAVYFEMAVKTVNYDLRWHLPEMIVVAVGTPRAELSEDGQRRSHELLPTRELGFSGFGAELLAKRLVARQAAGEPSLTGGGAATFLAFLVEELRVTLSREYRMADDHTLFGDSGGGLFCTYALFARPGAFARYICGSPPLNAGDFEMFRQEERYAKEHRDLKAALFLGAGEAELEEKDLIPALGIVSSTARMAEILGLRNYPSLKLHARIFAGEDHASVVPLNLSWGLRAVWQSEGQGAGNK